LAALGLSGVLSAAGCAHFLPATWRAYDVDPVLARPAIITAMKEKDLPLLKDNPGKNEITTEWQYRPEGALKVRERFKVTWEWDEADKLLVIYVRHEEQPEDYDGFKRSWGSSRHDSGLEGQLLDEIEEALLTLHSAMQPKGGEESSKDSEEATE
jgi:hypothetical protein